MRFIRVLLLLFIVLVISSCRTGSLTQEQRLEQFSRMNWLIGHWKYQSSGVEISEDWQKVNDTLFTGRAMTIIGYDTVLDEHLKITTINGNIFLATSTETDAGKAEFTYRLTKSSKNKFSFENSSVISQSLIVYTSVGEDALLLRLKGEEDGEPVDLDYQMSRVKP